MRLTLVQCVQYKISLLIPVLLSLVLSAFKLTAVHVRRTALSHLRTLRKRNLIVNFKQKDVVEGD